MLVPLESLSAVLVMISSKSVSICNRFHARRANSGKITISKGWVPLFDAFVRGKSPHPAAPNYLTKTRNSSLSYGENPESVCLSAVPAGTAVARKN